MARLLSKYHDEVFPKLQKEFGLANPMQVPRIEKITCNIGVGEASRNAKILDVAVEQLTLITGQKPLIRKAKTVHRGLQAARGDAGRLQGDAPGRRMYEFLDRLIAIGLPRVRDFRGTSPSAFDGRGNYTLGVRDILIFPEVDYQKVEETLGMNITITTTAPTDDQAKALLAGLGMPFRER